MQCLSIHIHTFFIICAFEEIESLLFPALCLCYREPQWLSMSLNQEVIIQPLGYVTVSHVVLPVNELNSNWWSCSEKLCDFVPDSCAHSVFFCQKPFCLIRSLSPSLRLSTYAKRKCITNACRQACP